MVILLAGGASAVTVSLEPDRIQQGVPVTIAIAGLPDGSVFSILVDGAVAVTPGDAFSFALEDFSLPFTLNDGVFSATLWNTKTNVLTVVVGDTEVRKLGSSRDGVYMTTDAGTIPRGTYDLIAFGGTAAADTTVVATRLLLEGRKSGPANSTIGFVVGGVTGGAVTITILVDGNQEVSRTLPIGDTVIVTPTRHRQRPRHRRQPRHRHRR